MANRIVFGLIAAIFGGCAVAPHLPRMPPTLNIPSPEEMTRKMMEAQGRGEAPPEAMDEEGVQVVFQTGHTSSLTAVGVSGDGRYLISGANDEPTRVWDVASGQEIRAITSSGFVWPRQVGFTPDGSRLYIQGMESAVFYDRQQGTRLSESRSPSVAAQGRIRIDQRVERATPVIALVDTVTGADIWKVPSNSGVVPSVAALSADGDTLLVREIKVDDGTAGYSNRLWRVSTRKSVPVENVGQWINVAVSAHGRWVALEDMRRTVILIDAATGKVVTRIAPAPSQFPGFSNTLMFSPDESLLAQATNEGHATLWHVPDANVAMTLDASAIGFSDDGKTLALGGREGGAPWLRDLASGTETRLSASTSKVNAMAVADGGAALLAAGSDGLVRQWDLTTGELSGTFACPVGKGAWSIAASATAPLFALGCMDGSITLFNRATGQRVATMVASASSDPVMTSTVFARGGDAGVVIAAVRNEIVVWDIASRSVRARFQLPPAVPPPQVAQTEAEVAQQMGVSAQLMADQHQHVRTLAVDASGRFLAVGRQNEVTLWDLQSTQLVRHMGVPRPGSLAAQASEAGPAGPPMTAAEMKKMFGRSGGGLLGGLKRGAGGAQPKVATAEAVNPFDVARELTSGARGAAHLEFSKDGARLYGDSATWEVATGYEIRPPSTALTANDLNNPQAIMDSMLKDSLRDSSVSAIAVSPDDRFIARATARVIRVSDAATDEDVLDLKGHRGDIDTLAFSPDGKRLFSAGGDGAVRVWAMPEGRQLVALTALGAQDFVAVTPDQFYRVSKARLSGVAFRQGGTLYPFEQFDLKFNRPDIILERLGASEALVQGYRQSYHRRLTKLGFTESTLASTSSLPQVSLNAAAVPVNTDGTSLNLDVHADGAGVALDRFNVFVNDVPVFGTRGLTIEASPVTVDRRVSVPLVKGRNKIQVSVQNARGVESLRQTAYTTSTAERAPPQVWVVAIGVSQYQRPEYSLRYAAKDAADIAEVYRSLGARTHVLSVSNGDATRQGIEAARRWLDQAKADDLVIVFAAGHGMTDSHQNYYFGTYDIDPDEPSRAGLPFESFENLLDGIAPLRKLLLVDTCFSGEIDKEDPVPAPSSTAVAGSGMLVMRSFKAARGVATVADDSATTAPSVRFQQDWFADLRRGTGAVVISSASGSEYALEGEQWNNGVFTYALLDGLKNRAADANGDHDVTVGELQTYVSNKVVELTRGGQNPTVRRENLAYDFTVF